RSCSHWSERLRFGLFHAFHNPRTTGAEAGRRDTAGWRLPPGPNAVSFCDTWSRICVTVGRSRGISPCAGGLRTVFFLPRLHSATYVPDGLDHSGGMRLGDQMVPTGRAGWPALLDWYL